MPRWRKNLNEVQQIQKFLNIAKNSFNTGNFRKGEAFLWKIKAIDSNYDVDATLRKVKYQINKHRRSNDEVEDEDVDEEEDEDVDAPRNFNNTNKCNNGTQKSTRVSLNGKDNNFINNELELLIKSINEFFSKGSLDKAQLILNKAEELYLPADIIAWRHKIQETKLKIKEETDKYARLKMKCLNSKEKNAFYYIDKAKETIVNLDLRTTEKYLRVALDLIAVPNENVSRNIQNSTELNYRNGEKNQQYYDETRKVSNVLEREMQTEAFKFIKKAEQAFFNSNFEEAEKFLLISKRISPDEYVEEMIALVENAKRESIPKERIENLRKTLFKESNNEQD